MDNRRKTLQYFVIICRQKHKNKFVKLLVEQGGHGINVIYGKGSAEAGFLAKAFGLETESPKAVISCLLPTERAQALIDDLCTEYDFEKANTGIAFSVPVGGLVI